MPSLDANCLLRWLVDDLPDQTIAVQALLDAGGPLFVEDAALVEVVFVLERQARLTRRSIKESIDAVMAVSAIDMNRPLWRDVLDIYIKRPKLSVADICFAINAQRQDRLPLYTFDRKMITQLPGCAKPPAPHIA
jgi:predicted nucleic-acid-binding protein